MKLSICVTIKDRSKLEFKGNTINVFPRSVQSIVDSVEKDEVELVISDWMSTDLPIREWVYDIVGGKFPVKVVDVYEKWFSRGKGLNVAAEEAASEVLFFTDADIIMTREVIVDAYEKCIRNIAFYPVCKHESRDDWISSGWGLCAVPRRMWKEVGRWQEWSSWGGEDNAFRGNINRAGYKIYRDRYNGFLHIDHPRDYSIYKNKLGSDYKKHVNKLQSDKKIVSDRKFLEAKKAAKKKKVDNAAKRRTKRRVSKADKLKSIRRRRKK
jgi:glycosyltransferase involved in cell wall biosynthesis